MTDRASPRSPPAYDLRIGKLVIDGFPASEARVIGAALEQELGQILADGPAPFADRRSGGEDNRVAVNRLDAGSPIGEWRRSVRQDVPEFLFQCGSDHARFARRKAVDYQLADVQIEARVGRGHSRTADGHFTPNLRFLTRSATARASRIRPAPCAECATSSPHCPRRRQERRLRARCCGCFRR